MMSRTKYQETHRYIRRHEVLCTETERDEHGRCDHCGRITERRVPHRPNRDGALGWVEIYADGTTYTTGPESTR